MRKPSELQITPSVFVTYVDGIPMLIVNGVAPSAANWWLLDLAEDKRTRSRNTWESYAGTLADFWSFCLTNEIDPINARRKHITTYWRAIRERSLKEREKELKIGSINTKVAALDRFFKFCVEQNLRIAPPPFNYRKTSRWSRDNRTGFTKNETIETNDDYEVDTDDLIDLPSRHEIRKFVKASGSNIRNHTMLLAIWLSGVRREELLTQFTVSNFLGVNRGGGMPEATAKELGPQGRLKALIKLLQETAENDRVMQVRIVGKRRRPRLIEIEPQLARELALYLDLRPKSDEDRFWIKSTGKLLQTKRAINQMMERLSAKVGVHLRPHMLRHSFAIEKLIVLTKNAMIEAGKNPKIGDRLDPTDGELTVLQTLLGHADITTTQIYLRYFRTYKVQVQTDHLKLYEHLWDGDGPI
jgi:site-specific recombinase XerD